jgi:outer membrane protein
MKSRIPLTIGLLLFATTALAQESPRPITLAEAVDLAQKNAPRIIEARGTVRTSEAEARSAYAAFLPSLTLSMGATRQLPFRGAATRIENGQVVTLPSEPWTYSTGAGASVQLFAGGRRLFEVSEAKAGERSAQSNEIAQRFGAVLDVKQQYFNVLAYREAVIAAQAEIDQAEQQFRTASLRVRAGSATISDSLRSEIQLRNARLDLSSAQNNVEVANASLTRAVGTPYSVTASEADSATLVGLSLSEAELRDLADRGPAVQVAKAELDRARAASKASKSPYLPTISASYNYLGSGTDSKFGLGDDPYGYNGSLRLALSYPIFDQLGREEQVVRASVAEDNAKAALRDATLEARQNLATYLAAYRTAEERVAAQTASLNSALEDLRVQQRRYDLGASTLLDLLASQTQVNNTREALIRARYDQRTAKAQLEALIGRSL